MIENQEKLNLIFKYEDGVLYWRKNGKKAGTPHHTGYTQISLHGKLRNAHRIIFMMHHGWLPDLIDHIDGNRKNDRIENLRPASFSENLRNMRLRPTNSSGHKNVSWCKTKKKWVVQLSVNGRQTNFGRFDDLELASLIATEVREKYHGAFARHF